MRQAVCVDGMKRCVETRRAALSWIVRVCDIDRLFVVVLIASIGSERADRPCYGLLACVALSEPVTYFGVSSGHLYTEFRIVLVLHRVRLPGRLRVVRLVNVGNDNG